MSIMLINATRPEELRVAIVDNQILQDLDFERTTHLEKRANIYKARVTSVEPSLDAVFVDFGSEKSGFLPFKEISPEYYQNYDPKRGEKPNVKEVIKVGQELMVQVEKDERGNKGAALTTYISLAGSYLVLMPNNPKAGGVSRRVEPSERDALREQLQALTIPEEMSVIVRTAGVGKHATQLQWDLEVLLTHWQSIQGVAKSRKAPFLIHQESDIVLRAIRDYLREDVTEIVIDEAESYQRCKEYIELARPKFSERVRCYNKSTPLFSHYQIERQIETAHQRVVNLPSGGSIVVDPAEALVAIDINSAKSTKGGNIEETAFHTNLEAANEIAKQLRLRDIGGLIVIDFIDMSSHQHQREVEQQLRNALKIDRARVQIGRISRFGLLEMSRQRLHTSLGETNKVVCPRCLGGGTIRTVESLTLSMLRIIEEVAMRPDVSCVQGQFPVEVATYMLNEKRQEVAEIEKRHRVSVVIIANKHMQTPDYQIRHLRTAVYKNLENKPASYKLVRTPTTTGKAKAFIQPQAPREKPAVNVVQTQKTVSLPKESWLKKCWRKLFGQPKAKTPPKPPARQQPQPRPRAGERRPQKPTRQRPSERHGKRPTDQSRSKSRRTTSGQQKSPAPKRQAESKSVDKSTHVKVPSLAVKSEETADSAQGQSAPKQPTQVDLDSSENAKPQRIFPQGSRTYGKKQNKPSTRGGRMAPDDQESIKSDQE